MSTETRTTRIEGHDYKARIGRDARVTIVVDGGRELARGWWRDDRIVDVEPPLPKDAIETLEDALKG